MPRKRFRPSARPFNTSKAARTGRVERPGWHALVKHEEHAPLAIGLFVLRVSMLWRVSACHPVSIRHPALCLIMKRRVVVTGIGAVTSLSCKVDDLWQKILRGQSGVHALRV